MGAVAAGAKGDNMRGGSTEQHDKNALSSI